MTEPEKRIGWGEPCSLSPQEADAARDIVADINPLFGTSLYEQWSVLRAVLIPPVEACQRNRDDIDLSANWTSRLDSPPQVGDPDYEEFEVVAGSVLLRAERAFESRPTGCEMVMSGDNDCFDCGRCNFSRSTDTLH